MRSQESGRARGRWIYLSLALGLGLALTFLFGAVASAGSAAGPQPPVQPAATAHGDVIVQFGDYGTAGRAITFTAGISGLDALGLSGLHVVTTTTQYGTAVCSIEGVGCPAASCFTCAGGRYWGYNYWAGGAWQSYPVGPSGSVLNDGAVEGWRWGNYGDSMTAPEPVTAALHALDWLRPRQSLTDGGYGGDSGTAEALLAISANHYSAESWRRVLNAPSIADYQAANAARYTRYGPAEAGKFTVAQVAGGASWPPSALQPAAYYNPQTGAYFEGTGPHAWAMLGTVALSQTVPAPAVGYLKHLVQPNGGWEWAPTWGTDTNSTALAIQALVATGEPLSSTLISRGLAFLKTAQNSDGGFVYMPGSAASTGSDADSTAYVVQAILAAGQSPVSGMWRIGATNPISYLLSLQLPDGSFEWQKGTGSNQLATEQATVALLGRTFFLRVVHLRMVYLPVMIRP